MRRFPLWIITVILGIISVISAEHTELLAKGRVSCRGSESLHGKREIKMQMFINAFHGHPFCGRQTVKPDGSFDIQCSTQGKIVYAWLEIYHACDGVCRKYYTLDAGWKDDYNIVLSEDDMQIKTSVCLTDLYQ
ncbi:unnamed protein product [Bursaphelenchus xylophilus]|uniref:(pine wood nematode) hypothetical protein n=1 Tax=Bursaphelenchus xylophilus TaxID=6326 RepID=A0A1I7SE17_BURXY|nr:unnamed protein product [Bursaphelenchus xylophilus]CAG9113171.1 unnamed protein product [Bursaphelenchus xylophilus]